MTGTIAKKGILTDGSGLARRGTPLLRKLGYKSSLSLYPDRIIPRNLFRRTNLMMTEKQREDERATCYRCRRYSNREFAKNGVLMERNSWIKEPIVTLYATIQLTFS